MYRVTRFLIHCKHEPRRMEYMFKVLSYRCKVTVYDTGTEPEKIWFNKEGFKIGTSRYNIQYMCTLYTEDSKQAGPW